jgi:hypothetical protein
MGVGFPGHDDLMRTLGERRACTRPVAAITLAFGVRVAMRVAVTQTLQFLCSSGTPLLIRKAAPPTREERRETRPPRVKACGQCGLDHDLFGRSRQESDSSAAAQIYVRVGARMQAVASREAV